MTEIKLNIKLDLPKVEKYGKPDNLYNKICEYIKICELEDQNSEYHWSYLKAVYTKLKTKSSLSSEGQEIIEKLAMFFDKNNSVSSDEQFVDDDGTDFFKYSPITGK